MGETDYTSANTLSDIVRTIFSTLDRPIFWLLGLCYELFFNVASADIFSNDIIMRFYGRVQIILGVYMMFRISMVILKGIVNPDSFTGDKGGKALITRIFTSLIILTILMPISIPNAKNEYEVQINNNGLLFGTLYSLQNRILSNNTIGRLVLGTTEDSESFVSSSGISESNLQKSARIFTSTILRGFYRINLKPESERDKKYLQEGKDPAAYNDNRICTDINDDVLKRYTKVDADSGDIISMVNEKCTIDFNVLNYIPIVQDFAGSKKYVFTYMPVISMIVGIVFIFILLSLTIDVAVRAVKLAVLRLIAPIPVIAYMDPKGGSDNAFNSWAKALTSTYLDLFIRLAVVYFVIFLIQNTISKGFIVGNGSGVLFVLTTIAIWIGLFVFAKQAPKFIKQVLGIKDDGGKFFSGLGEAMAVGSVAAGTVGGAVSNATATRQNGGNVGKTILAGFTGAIGGGFNAGKTYFGSKDANSKNIMSANRANNARNYTNASDESTFGGRTIAGIQGAVGVKNQKQRFDDKIADYGAANSAWKRINTALDSDDNKFAYSGPNVTDSRGNVLFRSGSNYSTKDANDILNRMKSSGTYSAEEIEAMENAKKTMQTAKFNDVRTRGASGADLYGTEAQIFQGAQTIFRVGRKYANDEDHVFELYRGVSSVDDTRLGMGAAFKGAAFNAERQSDALKNSPQYAKAKANDARAEQNAKK